MRRTWNSVLEEWPCEFCECSPFLELPVALCLAQPAVVCLHAIPAEHRIIARPPCRLATKPHHRVQLRPIVAESIPRRCPNRFSGSSIASRDGAVRLQINDQTSCWPYWPAQLGRC